MDKNNIYFTPHLKYSEDQEFIYKVINNCNKISISSYESYIYRIHDSSVMSKVDTSRVEAYNSIRDLEQYFQITNHKFYKYYAKFGLARWVFGTLWQVALASKNYSDFRLKHKKYNSKNNIRRLLLFPDIKVWLFSLLFLIAPYLYYKMMRMIGKVFLKRNYIKE